MTAPIKLKLAGGEYDWWEHIRVSRSLEQMTGEFELGLTGALGELDGYGSDIVGNERCQVFLHDQPVIDGFIEKPHASYNKDEHTVAVSGRDVTADLVDSSAQVDKQELHNVTIAAAAEKLLTDTGISVICPDPGKPFAKFAINDGESIFDTLDTHARQRGFLLYSLGDGCLHIGKQLGESTDIVLREGDNILSADSDGDVSKIYGEYIIKGQGKGGASTVATVTDSRSRPSRRLIIHAEQNEDSSLDLQQRAEWEKQSRRAASKRATVMVSGWLADSGKLWQHGWLVFLDSPRIKFREMMLVSGIEFAVDDKEGAVTTLTLVDPLTYAGQPT